MKNPSQAGDISVDNSDVVNNILSKRLNKVLETRVETDKVMQHCMKKKITWSTSWKSRALSFEPRCFTGHFRSIKGIVNIFY